MTKMNKHLILASASPRRKALMEEVGLSFQVVIPHCEEYYDSSQSPGYAIEQIALQKAKNVQQQHPQAIVLGCDTMVMLDGTALGKPNDRAHAKAMLLSLSGREHQVISGVAIVYPGGQKLFHVVTNVTFFTIHPDLLEVYLNSEEPYDKAGSYGIQGLGKLFVESIKGDYYNVVGLPIAKVYQYLQDLYTQV